VVLVDYLETQEPFVVWLRQTLQGDDDLDGLLDNIYSVWADEDADFPYLVYRLDNDYTPGGYITSGTLYVDLWDYNQLERRILQCRGHVLRLLDRKVVKCIGESISAARIWIQTDGYVPEEARNIWHRAMQFNVRYDRMLELEQIMGVNDNG